MGLYVSGIEIDNVYVNGQKMERVFVDAEMVYEATIYIDKPTVTATLTYNTSTQKPTITGYNSVAMAVSGTQSATNAGTYTIKFTLNKGYAWKDGTTDVLSYEWSIGRKAVTKPTLSGSFTYSGSSQTVTVNNYNSAAMTISGTQSATNVGDYHVYFALNSNYKWADGTTAKLDLTWRIKAAVTYPSAITLSGSFTIPSPYNRVQFFCVGGGGGSGNGVSADQGEGGGGGGYTSLSAVIKTSPNTVYVVHVGKGGSYADGEETYVSLGSSKLVSAAGGKMGGTVIYNYQVTEESSDSEGNIDTHEEDRSVTFGIGGAGGSGGGGGGSLTAYSSKGYGGTGGSNGTSGGAGYSQVSGDLVYDAYGKDVVKNYPTPGGTGQGSSTTFNGVTYSGGGGGGCNSYSTDSGYPYSSASTGLEGANGGGRGARTNSRRSGGTIYSQPTSGTPGTGGGCGGIVKASKHVAYNSSVFSVTGGSGAIAVKLWEE